MKSDSTSAFLSSDVADEFPFSLCRKTLETPAICAGLKGFECCTMAPPGGRSVQEHDLRTQTWTLHQIILPPASGECSLQPAQTYNDLLFR